MAPRAGAAVEGIQPLEVEGTLAVEAEVRQPFLRSDASTTRARREDDDATAISRPCAGMCRRMGRITVVRFGRVRAARARNVGSSNGMTNLLARGRVILLVEVLRLLWEEVRQQEEVGERVGQGRASR